MNTTANKITLVRILLIPVFMVLAYTEHVYIALTVYIIACLSDFADGYIARHYNQISNFGKFMDPLADKMLLLSAMCLLIEKAQMPAWAVAIVLFREFAVSGLRLIAVEQGTVIAAAKSGKLKTLCTMIALGVMQVLPQGWLPVPDILNKACVAIIVITTAVSGIQYFVVNRAVFRQAS